MVLPFLVTVFPGRTTFTDLPLSVITLPLLVTVVMRLAALGSEPSMLPK